MKVLMFTFESIYVKKVGGLAEVPSHLGEAITRHGIEVEIYTPSHGVIDACKDPTYTAKMGNTDYCIAKLSDAKPTHYVAGGGILDEPLVYPPGKLVEKSLTFAWLISNYIVNTTSKNDIVIFHGHDWHSAPALLAVNALSTKISFSAKLVYHVHLASKSRIELSDLCRIAQLCSDTLIRGNCGVRELSYYYDKAGGLVERLMALTVDEILTVSKGFLKSLVRLIGLDNANKVNYVYNASPITLSEVRDILIKAGIKAPERHTKRLEARKEMLTKSLRDVKIVGLEVGVEKHVEKLLEHYDVNYNAPFKSDGPLVFAIGRLSKQKGFDILLKSMDKLTLNDPDLKVVMAIAPSQWDIDSVKTYIEAVLSYPDNLRVFPGMISRENAVRLYYASNATVVPSRNEPFGLVALESMTCGTPVAASRVGGLADIVLDVREHGVRGVGILFKPGDVNDLAESTSYLVELMESGYRGSRKPWIIRSSCRRRASEFNWDNSARKMVNIYRTLVE